MVSPKNCIFTYKIVSFLILYRKLIHLENGKLLIKNLCNKTLKIKNLNWQFCCIFHWLCHGILHFFLEVYLHEEICNTKLPVLSFFSKRNQKCFLFCSIFHQLQCGILWFSVGVVFVEQSAKQNCLFPELFPKILKGHFLARTNFR